MEDKDPNLLVSGMKDIGVQTPPSAEATYKSPSDVNVLSAEPGVLEPLISQEQPQGNLSSRFLKATRRVDIVLGLLLLIGLVATVVVFAVAKNDSQQNNKTNDIDSNFGTVQIPLDEIVEGKNLRIAGGSNVTINGQLQVGGTMLLTPQVQPTGAKAGQIYFDEGTNQLAYFNGQNFVFLTSPSVTPGNLQSLTRVESLGGASGQLSVGTGLSVNGSEIANAGVLSVQGEAGNITLTAGPGVVVNGTNFSNSGIISVTAGGPNISVSDDGNGNVTIDVAAVPGTGTVTSSGGTSGRVALFTGVQNIEDSIITQSGLNVSVEGDLTVTGSFSLNAPLTVANGGTGATSLSADGVVISHGGAPLTSATTSTAGLCLVSTTGAPAFAVCPGGGVTTLNGLSGVLTIANATGSVNTITIDDAGTSSKGIASFNEANFTVSSGAVNTVQNIGPTASPTFTGVNTNNITPSGALTIGSAAHNFGIQGNIGSQFVVSGGGGTTTVGFAGGASGSVIYNFNRSVAPGTYEICTSAANCAGTGGGVTTTGGTANRLSKFTGAQTIADSSISDDGSAVTILGTASLLVQGGTATFGTLAQAGSLVLSDGSSNTATIVVSGYTANRTYTIPDVGADASFCLSTGNCIGSAGGGAPNDAAYILAGLNGTLSNERALTAGSNLSLNDAGANGALTIATIQNPTFSTSVTTPLVQSSGALTITSAGAITFTGLNCTTFANGGALTANASGQLVCSDDDGGVAGAISGSGTNGTIPVFTGAQTIADSIILQSGTTISIAGDLTLGTALSVANGGTGATSFTTNGVLFGNGAGTLQVTSAGTAGQVLIANASGVPTFTTFSGDISVSSTGAVAIQPNSVALGTDTAGDYIATLGTLTGLSTTGNSGEGSTPGLSVLYGAVANTAVQGNTTLTCTAGTGNLTGGGNSATLGAGGSCGDIAIVNNPAFNTSVTTPTVILTGAGSNGSLQVASLGQATIYTLPDPGQATASFCLSTGNCTALGTAGGDLTGDYPNPTIASLQGGTLSITAVASGNILQFNGTAWVNHNISGDITLNNSGVATIANDAVTSAKIANATISNADLVTGSFTNITGVGTLTGLTVAGAANINTSGTANTAIGNATGTFQVTSPGLNVSTTGVLSGVAGITTTGGYLQSGFTANTFSGVSSFTAAGTSLSVTNNATISGALTVNTITPNAVLTIGAATQSFGLQGNAASTISATDSTFTTTLSFATPTANTTIGIPALGGGSYILCTSSGNCGGVGATLQTAYNNSINTEIVLDATRGALTVRDSVSGIGANLLEVQNNDGSTTYFNVTASGINTTGVNTASGNINTTGGNIQTNTTSRIDVAGNLVNIGNLTAAGAITIASTGATNDIILDGADQLIVQDAVVFNGMAAFNTDVDLSFVDTENLNLTSTVNGVNAVNLLSVTLANNSTSGTQQAVMLQNAAGSGSTEALLAMDNTDNAAVSAALQILSTGAGGYTTILDTPSLDITGAGAITGATGITSSGTVTFSGLSTAGIVTNTAAGVLGTVSTLGIAQGGTGASTIQGAINALSGLTTTGDLLYYDGTNATRLPRGASGQCLASNATTIAWSGCTLQAAYNASTSPELLLDATNGALTIRRDAAGAVTTLLEVQSNAGVDYFSVNTGGVKVNGTVNAGDAGTIIATTYRSDDQSAASTSSAQTTFTSGQVSGTASNSGAVALQSGYSITSGNTGNVLITSGNATSGNSGSVTIAVGAASGTQGTILISGTTTVQGATNSASAFRVLNAGSVPHFSIDTVSSRVYIGSTTPDSTGALLVLDNHATDSTGVNGAMYYNSTNNKFRCYEGGAWRDCLGSGPQIITFTTSGTFSKASYPWATRIKVRIVGGGGGGGAAVATAASQASVGGGGGGGAYGEISLPFSSLGSSETVTVGGGGAGASSSGTGGTGGASSFGSFISVFGGSGGITRGASTVSFGAEGGYGGAGGSGGDFITGGGPGTAGFADGQLGISGAGGSSQLGGGGQGNRTVTSASKLPGIDGYNYGGGGGGAINSSSVTLSAGGSGAPGVVIIELY